MSTTLATRDIAPEPPTAKNRDEAFLSYAGGVTLTHQPGLDGVRGLAVAAVVVFHVRPTFVPGGPGGVSLFYALSGFLISSLILQNIQRHGQFRITQFWKARARRLLPASFLVIAIVSVVRVTTDAFTATKRPDAVMTLIHVNNWYQVLGDPGSGILNGISAYGHMWSLSIEEQFYIAIGLLMLIFVRWKLSLRTLAALAFAGATISFLLPVVVELTSWRVYLGTDTRAGEILAGVCLATVLFTRRDRVWLLHHRDWVAGIGLAGTLGMVAIFFRQNPFAFGLDLRLFPLMSVLSVTMILGALVPHGPAHSMLSLAPLTWLGRRSYAVYLFHIPVAFAVNDWSLAHTQLGLATLTVGITLLFAELSYHLVEMPIRTRRFRGPPLAAACAIVLAVIAICSFIE